MRGVKLNVIMTLSQCHHDLISCCTWSPDVSTGGVKLRVNLSCTLHLKIWTHFRFYSSSTEVCIHHLKNTALGHQMPLLGGVNLSCTLPLKIWTHFGFDSCITEVFSTKDQSVKGDIISRDCVCDGPTWSMQIMHKICRVTSILWGCDRRDFNSNRLCP